MRPSVTFSMTGRRRYLSVSSVQVNLSGGPSMTLRDLRAELYWGTRD